MAQKPPLEGPKRRLIKDIEAEIKGLEPRFFVERSILEAEGIGSGQRGRAKRRLETLDKKLASLNAELQEIREANKRRLTGVPFGPTPSGFIVDEVQEFAPSDGQKIIEGIREHLLGGSDKGIDPHVGDYRDYLPEPADGSEEVYGRAEDSEEFSNWEHRKNPEPPHEMGTGVNLRLDPGSGRYFRLGFQASLGVPKVTAIEAVSPEATKHLVSDEEMARHNRCPDCGGSGYVSKMDGTTIGECTNSIHDYTPTEQGALDAAVAKYAIKVSFTEEVDHEVQILVPEPEAQGSESVEAGSALEAEPLTWNIPEFNVFKGLSPARSEPDGHGGWTYFDAEGRAIGGLVPRYHPEVHPSSAFAPGGLLPKREENAVTEPVVATEETAKPLVVFGEEPPPFVRKPVDPKNRKKRDAKFDKYVQLAVDNPDAWGRLADVENKTSSLRAALAKTYADLTDEDGRKLEVVARRVSEPGEPDLFGFWIIFRVPTPATVDAEGHAPEMSEPEE